MSTASPARPHDQPGGAVPATEAPPRATAWVLLVGGLTGAGAALVLLLEKLALLADPGRVPACSIDAVLSCGSIMRSPQSEVLGFPNPVVGLLAFPLLAVTGALLLAGTALPAWYWAALQAGSVAGLGFVVWLGVQSTTVIGALCPWCLLVWAVTIAVFWHVSAHGFACGRLEAGRAGRWVARRPGAATLASLLAVAGALVAAFPAWFAHVLLG